MESSEDRASVQHLLELGYEDPLAVARRRQQEIAALDAALQQAQGLLERRSYAEAIRVLEQAPPGADESPALHRLLAHAYFRAGDHAPALAQLRWLEIHGYEHAEFALLRGGIAMFRRQLREVIEHAEYARCLQTPCVKADLLLGEAHFRLADLTAGDSAYRRALEAEASNAAALAGLAAVSLRHGDLAASLDFALQALETGPQPPAVHYRLGLALLQMGRTAEARAALSMAAQLGPHLSGPHRWLAASYRGDDESKAQQHRSQARDVIARRRPSR